MIKLCGVKNKRLLTTQIQQFGWFTGNKKKKEIDSYGILIIDILKLINYFYREMTCNFQLYIMRSWKETCYFSFKN